MGGFQSELITLCHCIIFIHIGAWIFMAAKCYREESKILAYSTFQVSLHRDMYGTMMVLYMHCEDGTFSETIALV